MDPEKINVLKYVATFKDRLFRAGQMAKRNHQKSQSKMKDNPLQAKYSGPYKVVKKISDTIYLLKTPGRRKETHVCNINMLKA